MQANGSEFEANGFHGAVEAALLQCTMELDSAYVQGDMVRGREQGHLQRRVRPPWLRGSGVSEKYDLGVRNHPLMEAIKSVVQFIHVIGVPNRKGKAHSLEQSILTGY